MSYTDPLYVPGNLLLPSRHSRPSGTLADTTGTISSLLDVIDASTSNSQTHLPRCLADLGKALTARFILTGDSHDISEAVAYGRRAIGLTPESYADLPDFLTNLGNSLMYQFQCTGEIDDISEAITVQRRAVHLTPEDHKDMPVLQTNLGFSLTRRFERTRQLNDISEAVHAHQEAVRLGSKNSPTERDQFGDNLWKALELCFEHSQELALLQKATISFRRFSTSQLGSPSKELRQNARKWADRRPERRLKAKSVIKEVLGQLWDFLVKPILDALDCSLRSNSERLRIWWCTTGPLAFLPIHAAGIYDHSESTTLSDFATSSYIPSVSALIERIKRPRTIDDSETGLVMISQPDTPGQQPIPGATREVRLIGELLESHRVRQLCLERSVATVDQGTKQMKSYSCIHFACHANQDTSDPLKRAFHLHDGPLELSAIMKQDLARADLAFLAACQTSKGDEKLSEEAVHLAAGMLAAGYRGVIATMWSISDSVAPKIAEKFYSNLIAANWRILDGRKAQGFSSAGAADALRRATEDVRMELGDSDEGLLAWVPYVHFGL